MVLKALLGAVIVVALSLAAKSKNFYMAGLLPLFPTFALVGHYMVFSERGIEATRETALFGMLSLIPYFCYLCCVYFLLEHLGLRKTLLISVFVWIVVAAILINFWKLR